MLYAFLGSSLLGSLAVVFLLWRKSAVETSLAQSQAEAKEAQERANRALSELELQSSAYKDQISRLNDQVTILRTQRDQAIDKLAKGSSPGDIADLLRMQNLPTNTDPSKSST